MTSCPLALVHASQPASCGKDGGTHTRAQSIGLLEEVIFDSKKRRRKKDAETFTQFAPRLETYLFRWLELRGKVERAFEDLVDLLQEQLIGIPCQPLTGSRSCADVLQGQLIGSVSAFER